ncbi:hypothetical protein D3875_05405 [Deinococcus cavernae]|uniref:Uncharacterized protein n=1 Tax=Deinococcus cavernae TaxID=2320857 RepID=A0A418V4R1_9DEIO|nr:hypothetical protein [Deinococcus cavernae]RJF71101.1 hypothetical protein D3875_05405 [Deinococcus cavernae]
MTDPPPTPRRPTPDLPTILSFVMLGLLAVLLFVPILGGPLPSPFLIGGLLLVRLALQIWRAQKDDRLKRPASWALDILLIGLIFYVASNQ